MFLITTGGSWGYADCLQCSLVWLPLCGLVGGVMVMIVSLQEREIFARWWVLLLEGLAGFAAGVLSVNFEILRLLHTLAAHWNPGTMFTLFEVFAVLRLK